MMWKLAALITATLTLTPLACARGGNNETLLVIYCQADCWMSWNAAKQALSYGYTNVAWYPEGTDGWQRANLPLADSQPDRGQVRRRHFPANDSTSGRRPAWMPGTPSPAGSRGRGQIGAGQSQ